MHITLVGKRNGRRVICWAPWLKLTAVTVCTGILLATAVYVLLAQRWNSLAPLAGAGAGLTASLLCIIVNLITPFGRLPTIGN